MGYHRDPDHFKSISPYGMIFTIPALILGLMGADGELRRRIWAMLYHLGYVLTLLCCTVLDTFSRASLSYY